MNLFPSFPYSSFFFWRFVRARGCETICSRSSINMRMSWIGVWTLEKLMEPQLKIMTRRVALILRHRSMNCGILFNFLAVCSAVGSGILIGRWFISFFLSSPHFHERALLNQYIDLKISPARNFVSRSSHGKTQFSLIQPCSFSKFLHF